MNTARIVVLTIAVGAGGIAAYLASGSDNKPPPEPVAQLQTVDVLVAKSDIGLGQTVTPEDMLWQTWPAATASNTFIRRNQRPDADNPARGLDRALALHRGRTDPRTEAGQGQRLRLHGGDPAGRHARDFDRNFAGNRRRRLHSAQRPGRRDPFKAREERGSSGATGHRQFGNHPSQRARARDRSGAQGEGRPERRGRQDRDARAEARAGGDAGARAPDRHACAGAAQHRRRQHGRKQNRRSGLRSEAKASTWFATASQARRRRRSDRKDVRHETRRTSAWRCGPFWSAPCRFRRSPR